MPGQEKTLAVPPCLIAHAIRSIIRNQCVSYADPCNGGSRRRLYIRSPRDHTSRCPRKSIRARTLRRISPPRLSVGVLPARYSSFSSVYTIVALCEIFVNRFSEIFGRIYFSMQMGRRGRRPLPVEKSVFKNQYVKQPNRKCNPSIVALGPGQATFHHKTRP